MQKTYEYKTLRGDALPAAEQLTELGAIGWRTTAIIPMDGSGGMGSWYAIYLEREIIKTSH